MKRSSKAIITSDIYQINNLGCDELQDKPKVLVINTNTCNYFVILVRKSFLAKFSISDGLFLLKEGIKHVWGFNGDEKAIYTDNDGYLQIASDKAYKYLSEYRYKIVYSNDFDMDTFIAEINKAEEYKRKFIIAMEKIY